MVRVERQGGVDGEDARKGELEKVNAKEIMSD